MSKQSFGKKGEQKAINHLKEKGFNILESNFHKRSGEIDIIAFDPKYNEYVFVEVKTRRNSELGYPEEFVDQQKISKIIKTAEQWLHKKGINEPEWRIDIVSVEWGKDEPVIRHIENIS